MNHFPFMAPVSQTVINAIQNLNKENFSGAMPFVYLHAHGPFVKTIGTETSYEYNPNLGFRFPPLITNLEVKPTGTMGVVREGSVTVKFASMSQLKLYQEYFRIGNAKTIVWGWNQNRITGANMPDITINDAFSKPFVGNINYWQSWIAGKSLSADVMVGPLINFSLTLNNDASVDVIFQIGSPNELVAYMGSHKTDVESAKASDENNIASYRVASLLNLLDKNFIPGPGSNFDTEIRPNLLNYNTAQSTLSKLWKSASTFFNSITGIGTNYDNVSEEVYMSFFLIAKYALNQGKTGKYIFDLEDAVSVAHPNMISNSENVIFLNTTMANPVVANNEITLNVGIPQNFDTLLTHEYPEKNDLNRTYTNLSGGSSKNFVEKRRWGRVYNVFFKVSFVQDVIKNNGDGNIVDIVEKLCNEINVASCGLTDLAPQTVSTKGDTEVFTVVDYALVPQTPSSIPTLNLFESQLLGNSSTITNVSFNCDLPKEIAAMTMLGNKKGTNAGGGSFFATRKNDPVLGTPGPSGYTGTTQTVAPVAATTPVLIDESVILIQNDPLDHKVGAQNVGTTKAIFKNTDLIKTLYFGKSGGHNDSNPLLPIELEITVLGISGIVAGQVLKLPANTLPFGNNGIFQVKEVNHTVAGNKWETIIKLGFRPGK